MVRIKEITVGKEFKLGLANFSNITAHAYMTVEIGEGEQPDWDGVWDEINYQVWKQVDGLDPQWIKEGETKDYFKFVIKIPKEKSEKVQ